MPTSTAWREFLSVYASHLMLLRMRGIMDHPIDARTLNLVSGFENVSWVNRHFSSFAGKRTAKRGNFTPRLIVQQL